VHARRHLAHVHPNLCGFDKAQAAPTWKKTFGFHPLSAFADHDGDGTGEPLALMLRPGNAGSSTAADHIAVTKLALAQLPPGRTALIRTDSGGGTHEFTSWLHRRRLQYPVGFPVSAAGVTAAVTAVPARAWTPAYDAGGVQRPGAWVADLTGLLDLAGWPPGMRVIARKERPHPGAQLRLTDVDGHRITCFATSTRRGQLADLELRHRRRARCEERIRCAKDTGLRNLPLHGFAQNQVWCELVALASELTAWTQMLALAGTPARRWEPRRLRFRLFATAGRIIRGGRRTTLRLARQSPWTALITTALTRLNSLAPG
jgi:Transposase DDE domain group 1